MPEKQRFLLKVPEGTRFVWTEALAKRADMVECDKEGVAFAPKMEAHLTQVDVLGKTIVIDKVYADLLKGIARQVDDMSAQLADANKSLDTISKKEHKASNENSKLKQALDQANARIAALEKSGG